MRPRKILRIARWEVTKNAGGVDRKTIAIVVVTLAIMGAVTPLVASQGVALDEGIYRVDVDEDSPLYRVVQNDSTFAVAEGGATLGDGAELKVESGPGRRVTVQTADSAKGRAALTELRDSIGTYNDAVMTGERNQSAAFPVTVTLNYVERDVSVTLGDGTGNGTDTSEVNGTGSDGGTPGAGGGTPADSDGGGSAGGAGAGGSDGSDGADGAGGSDGAGGTGGSGGTGGLGGFGNLGGGTQSGSPSDISPPFPFQSLVLAFVFVLPLNFVIQAYGSTILSERLNRRGELMLVSPVTRGDIIAGKTLPYFAGALFFEAIITVGVATLRDGAEASAYSLVAVVPLVLLFLAATFLGAMFARSFKELTFVTVAITVSLTSYAFVPAIFTDVTPIALISPLTIVVRDLAGQSITLTALGFSTLPPLLTSLLFFGLGAGLYREEDMFTQRPIPLKALDALAGRISGIRSVGVVVAALIPFVIVGELLAVAAIYPVSLSAVPRWVTLTLILGSIVIIEELAKGLPIYAGYVHRRYDRSLRSALLVGFASGLGFFLVEKGLLLIRLLNADLPDVQRAAVATSGPLSDIGIAGALLLLFAPLALHVVTATATAIAGRKGRSGLVLGLVVAITIHFAYNFTVVSVYV